VDETDELAVEEPWVLAAFGKLGAMELQALELPKAWRLTREGGGLVRLSIQRLNQCGGEAELELKRVGVPIVNRDFDRVNLYFDVKRSQANWAEYVLHRAGFVVTSAPVDPRNAEWARGKGRVPAWRDKGQVDNRESLRGWWGHLLDWLLGG